jgi:hypothetical protein
MERSTDQLPDKRFVQAIRQAGRVAQEFKSRQRLSSLGGQLGYLVQTEDDWDLTQTLATTPPVTYQFATFELVVTGSGRQQFPMVTPVLDVRVNGTDSSHKVAPMYGGAFYGTLGWASGANILLLNRTVPDLTYIEDEYVQRWTFGFSYQGSITYYAKAYALSSSDATLELTRLT